MNIFGAKAGEVDANADATGFMRYRVPLAPAYQLIVSNFSEQVTVFARITGEGVQPLVEDFDADGAVFADAADIQRQARRRDRAPGRCACARMRLGGS